MNKIEEYKQEKDGLDILQDVPRYAAEGWEAITDGDKERLKWTGVFFRRQTPGHFMMRVRIPNGFLTATQLRTIGDISRKFGKGFADLTTRQQVQLRWFTINDVPEIWDRLRAVDLISLQTGMDNIRGVIGCPVAGLTPNELFDASQVVHEFTNLFVGNKAYTNLPRKFNVTITACKEACTHAEAQDIGLTPATKEIDGAETKGFNVAAGGKMGSGGYRIASPLDLFVTPHEAAAICSQIVMIFRDYGARELRTKARLAFLIEDWGVAKFRSELERRVDRPLASAGIDQRTPKHTDHIGVFRQKQAGLNYVGLTVPVGRVTSEQMLQVAGLAEMYGNGQLRLTVGQNIIIPNVPDDKIGELTEEPVLKELRYDPSEVMRGLVSCTGMDYCHFALIETKGWALKTARTLETKLGKTQPLRMHWSGCPAGCGNHATADIGLLGKNIKVNGEIVEAVDVFAGGAAGCEPNFPVKIMEDVPCDDLPEVIGGLVKHGAFKAMRQQLRKISQTTSTHSVRPPERNEPAQPMIDPKDIAEGSAKRVRMRGEEMARIQMECIERRHRHGHKASGGTGQVKWGELAQSVDTLVIVMGLHNLREIMSRLMEGGCKPQRPAALIQSGTRVSQKIATGTVDTLVELAYRYKFSTPTVIVVGEVVNLGRELQWFPQTLFDYQLSRYAARKNSVEFHGL